MPTSCRGALDLCLSSLTFHLAQTCSVLYFTACLTEVSWLYYHGTVRKGTVQYNTALRKSSIPTPRLSLSLSLSRGRWGKGRLVKAFLILLSILID